MLVESFKRLWRAILLSSPEISSTGEIPRSDTTATLAAWRAGRAIERARATARPSARGGDHIGFVAVIGGMFHAETSDGRSLGSFPSNEAAMVALAKAARNGR